MKKLFLALTLASSLSLFSQKHIPDVSIKDLQGTSVSPKNFNEKDKLYVFSFWATWCVPCIQELDAFSELYDDWKSKLNMEIIAVSVDDARTVKRVKPMVSGKGWDYKILSDVNNELKRSLGIVTVPYLIIVKNGEIVYTQNGHSPGGEEELFNQLEKFK